MFVALTKSIVEGIMATTCSKSLVGASTHTAAACSELEDARAGVGIRSIKPADGDGGRVTLTTDAGDEISYDAVILATHANISLAMLGGSCPQVGSCGNGKDSLIADIVHSIDMSRGGWGDQQQQCVRWHTHALPTRRQRSLLAIL